MTEQQLRDKQIAERDETIRKLRDPVAVHIAMLRGEIAIPPLAELLHVYGATFSDLDAANIELAKARAEATKWERLHDELYAEIASEHRRDEYGETETAAECVRRIIRERDQLRAQLDEYERAPMIAILVEALRTARDYVFCELETERQQMKGYERISRIDEIASDLAEIDAALAKAGVL